jgi:hypothetical protein
VSPLCGNADIVLEISTMRRAMSGAISSTPSRLDGRIEFLEPVDEKGGLYV